MPPSSIASAMQGNPLVALRGADGEWHVAAAQARMAEFSTNRSGPPASRRKHEQLVARPWKILGVHGVDAGELRHGRHQFRSGRSGGQRSLSAANS